jgi:phosphomannomutase
MILASTAARARKLKLSELLRELPSHHTFSDRLQDVDVQACRALLGRLASDPSAFSRLGKALPPATAIDLTDGVRATLDTGEILHLRLSGNAPELRCYAEASSLERAETLCKDSLQRIAVMIGGPARS